METRTLEYALKNLSTIQTSETFYIDDRNIYLEFSDGRTIKLHEYEVFYQATEYLKDELEYIKEQQK